ncbi:MAG: YfhO family protein [Planctomycetes bacterium]|nr:YfhO family protein [Planctomycetota bacterium]
MSERPAVVSRSRRRHDAFALLVLLALVLVPVAATLAGDRAYLPRHPGARDLPWSAVAGAEFAAEPDNRSFNDKIWLIHPGLAYGSAALRGGRLPLWNPSLLAGLPHAANPMSAVFYPPNWAVAWLPSVDAVLAIAALHVLLGGVFMLMFLRTSGLSPGAALIGAIGFAFSGWVAAHLHNTQLVATVVWVPLGLWAMERLFRHGRSGPGPFAALAMAVAMMWLAGFPQFALLGCVALLTYAVCGLLANRGRQLLRRAAWLGAAAVTGLLLAAVQLLPTLELMQRAARGPRTVADLQSEHYRPGAWIGLVLPRTLGDPMRGEDWRQQGLAPALLGEGPQRTPPLIGNWSERTVYPGIAVLLLAVLGLGSRRRRTAVSLIVTAGVGVAMACSTVCIAGYGRLPGFAAGAPARAVLLLAIAVPALAACGWRVLLDHVERRLGAALVVALFAIAVGAGALAAVALVADWYEGLVVDLVVLAATTLALGGLLLLHRRATLGRRALCAGLIAVVAADLLAFWLPVNQPVAKARLYETTPALRFLSENLGHDRFLRMSENRAQAVTDRPVLFHCNQNLLFGLRDAQGYGILVPRPYLELWRELASLWSGVGFAGIAVGDAASPVLDLAAVRYLIAARPMRELAELQVHPEPGANGDLWIYRNPDFLPRARLVSRARVAEADAARHLLLDGAVDLTEEVLVDRLPDRPSNAVAGSRDPAANGVDWIRDEPESLEFRVQADAPCYLVVADTWDPGWQARVIDAEGRRRQAPILQAMTCFRAVALAPGDRRVEMVYRPWSIRVGIVTSLLVLVIGAVVLVVWWRRSTIRRPRPHRPASQRDRSVLPDRGPSPG